MTDGMHCSDSDALLPYLYGEADPDTQRAVEAHLRTCRSCAAELDGLAGVRGALQAWVPPGHAPVSLPAGAAAQGARRWSSVPAWAAVVAATLVLATGAAVANLRVSVGDGELRVSTGWSRTATAPAAEMATAAPAVSDEAAAAEGAEWRAAVAAVRAELRLEIEAARTAATAASAIAPAPAAAVDNAAVLRRVQALIEESEQRQREQLAFRLTQASRDFEVQRRADLGRIEQEFGSVAGRADVEAAQNRQLLNYLVRVSGQTPQ